MNIGTGLKETVKLHLPGLNITNNIKKVRNTVNNLGITMNEEEGDIFEISTTQIIGTTEENIKESIKPIIDNIIENERKLRKYLIKNTEDIEDEILRDFGIIAYSNKIKDEEYQNLISMVKMGVDLGILEKVDDTKIKKILNYSNPYTLAKYLGQDITNLDIEKERAKILKEIINK